VVIWHLLFYRWNNAETAEAMDLNDVVVFAKVVQTGSFTRAARELKLPKSTVSRKVSELEARLGARLLQRTTRSLSVTDAGRAFHEHASRIVGELEAGAAAVQELEEAPRGHLRVTAPINFGVFASVLSSFVKRYPGVDVELVCSDRMVDLVEEQFDVAIRASRLKDSALVARPLGVLRSVVVASPAYVAKNGEPRKPKDLVEHACLMFGGGPDRGHFRLNRKGKEEVVTIDGTIVTNDFEILHEAARDGLGVAMLPFPRIAGDLEAGLLLRLLPEWSTAAYPIHAVYPSTRHLSPKVRAFVDHVATANDKLPWEPLDVR
jgi:DNA-binding transcriptional LysR family regulator